MKRQRQGVTLIELAIAMAMLAVLGALALPSLGARLDRQRLAGAAEALVSDINEARFEAARQGRALHVLATPGAAWCWAVALEAGCPCGTAQACELRHAQPKDHPGIRVVNTQPVRLDAAGTAGAAGSTLLESRRGVQLRVDVQVLGRARICAPGGTAAIDRYPPC